VDSEHTCTDIIFTILGHKARQANMRLDNTTHTDDTDRHWQPLVGTGLNVVLHRATGKMMMQIGTSLLLIVQFAV